MTAFLETFNRLAGAWAKVIWAVTWQSTLLVAVFAIVALAMRRSSPGLRYWVWQIAAIKLLVMPLWGVSILIPATSHSNAGVDLEEGLAARSDGELAARPPDCATGSIRTRRAAASQAAGNCDGPGRLTGVPGSLSAGGSWSPARARPSRTSESG